MKVSALDKQSDWQFGRGKALYLQASDAIKQNVVTRIKSFTRDWYLDTEANIDWIGLLSTRGVLSETIRRQVERVVRRTDGVARVDTIDVRLDRASRDISITLTVVDIYNVTSVIRGVQI